MRQKSGWALRLKSNFLRSDLILRVRDLLRKTDPLSPKPYKLYQAEA